MLRRRRPAKSEAIHFSFDAFLDLVTNVVGIIIRLILVTWVGARSYHASMQWIDSEPASINKSIDPPKITDDPLHARLVFAQRDLDDVKTRLLTQLKDIESAEETQATTESQLTALHKQRADLEKEHADLIANNAAAGTQVNEVKVSIDDVRKRTKSLLSEIKQVEAQPARTKALKYHAPVSRTVHSDEIFFECRAGRVSYIDLPAFMREVKSTTDDIVQELKTTYRVERTTSPIGPYRLRYAYERERTALDVGEPSPNGFRYGLSDWVVEPLHPERGETQSQALAEKSRFRTLVDALDGNITVVTFWVYPDSFETFRALRDHLYDRNIDVAGRPLPPGAPIAASRNGSASRGQ